MKLLLRFWLMLLLAAPAVAPASTAVAQLRMPCSDVAEIERDFVRRLGLCRDVAPIVDVPPKTVEPAAPNTLPVANVVGLGFDEARNQLGRFTVQRLYRASSEPGGTVLTQQPAPPARLAPGAVVRIVLSDGSLRPAPNVPASQVDGVRPMPAAEPSTPAAVITQPAPPSAAIPQPASPPVAATPQPASPPVVQRSESQPMQTPTPRAVPPQVELLRVPNVVGMPIRRAQTQLGRFTVERRERASDAPVGRVLQQIPRAASRVNPGETIVLVVSSGPARASTPARAPQPAVPAAATVAEILELPNVVERNITDASSALAEFKVNRIDIAGAA
ncbi:MAG: PASTA domain-containing protein, partial [Burkholderiaceae bacterium]